MGVCGVLGLALGSCKEEGEDDGVALMLRLGSALGSEESVGAELGPSEAALGSLESDGYMLMLGIPEGCGVGKNEGGLVGKSSTNNETTLPQIST